MSKEAFDAPAVTPPAVLPDDLVGASDVAPPLVLSRGGEPGDAVLLVEIDFFGGPLTASTDIDIDGTVSAPVPGVTAVVQVSETIDATIEAPVPGVDAVVTLDIDTITIDATVEAPVPGVTATAEVTVTLDGVIEAPVPGVVAQADIAGTPAITAEIEAPVPGVQAFVDSIDYTVLELTETDAWKQPVTAGSTTDSTFTVSRLGNISGSSSVNWATEAWGDNPAAATDFDGDAFPSGSHSWSASETDKTSTVTVKPLVLDGLDKGYRVFLSGETGATIQEAYAYGMIEANTQPSDIWATLLSRIQFLHSPLLKVIPGWTGKAITIRNHVTGEDKEFGYDANPTALAKRIAAFVYPNTDKAYVVNVRDQTGHGYDLTQDSYGAQPVLDLVKWRIDFDDPLFEKFLLIPNCPTINQPWSVITAGVKTQPGFGTLVSTSSLSNNAGLYYETDGGPKFSVDGGAELSTSIVDGTPAYLIGTTVPQRGVLAYNSGEAGNSNNSVGTGSIDQLILGSGNDPSVRFRGASAFLMATDCWLGHGWRLWIEAWLAANTLGGDVALGTINNYVRIQRLAADQPEGGAHTFRITRYGDVSGTASVLYSVTGTGTTPANSGDFGGSFPTDVLVSFSASQATQDITINSTADAGAEGNETFLVTLSTPTSCLLDPDETSAIGTIADLEGITASIPAPVPGVSAVITTPTTQGASQVWVTRQQRSRTRFYQSSAAPLNVELPTIDASVAAPVPGVDGSVTVTLFDTLPSTGPTWVRVRRKRRRS